MKATIYIFAMMLLMTSTVNAQQARYGLTAGSSFSRMILKDVPDMSSFKSLTGITFGLQGYIKAGKKLVFQPAINYVQKGAWSEQEEGGMKLKSTIRVQQVEVPLNFTYSMGNFFIGGGPSLGFNIGGKAKFESSILNGEEKLNFGNKDTDDLRGFDPALNVVAGYASPGGLLFSFNYNRGIRKLNPSSAAEGKVFSSYLGLRVGYLFLKN